MTTERILQSVLGALRASGEDCFLEDTMALCPHLTWNQVFLAVDDLSRTGRVRMTRDAGGGYRIHLVESLAVPAVG